VLSAWAKGATKVRAIRQGRARGRILNSWCVVLSDIDVFDVYDADYAYFKWEIFPCILIP
jgi:hypothetical protein